jgi:adenosylmethionine-8-amino-7-oxononanoate aminotransferase
VFFSDDGSTAVEVALKLAYAYARRTGRSRRPAFLSLDGAYHGDTVGAVSLGHIDLFHKAYAGLLFKSTKVRAPYCYRCRFNRAKPARADARDYRQCHWECLGDLQKKLTHQRRKGEPFAAFVLEPRIQGAAGMIAQPPGWLRQATDLVRGEGTQVIADEVMTGFGRTGPVFACQAENVKPDYLALAKGLTGGYLPMAATLTTQAVFDAFLGDYSEFKTFFHGHSYTGNQLGAAAGLASLGLLRSRESIRARAALEGVLEHELSRLWSAPQVGDIRRVGLVAGVELVRDWRTREPFDLRDRAGFRVCEAMAGRGVLTRPVGNVIVLMPPYCTTAEQLMQLIDTLLASILEVLA